MEQLDNKELAVLDKKIKEVGRITELTYKNILSLDPPEKIVKYHEFGKFHYLPITAIERLLDGLFEWWTAEILREGVAVNGFYVVVRLKAKIPNSEKVLQADGIGFAEFQTMKGAAPTDFTKLSQAAGVMAVPKAKTEAIKNAAKLFGNLFGRNLVRDDYNLENEMDVVNTSRNKIANTLGAKNETN
jgi:predicted RecA/RadA family phage recombinase